MSSDSGASRPLRELYFELGRVLSASSRNSEAIPILEQALKEDGPTPELWEIGFCLAEAYEELGENHRAFRVYLEAIASAPEHLADKLGFAHNLLSRRTAVSDMEWLRGEWAGKIERANLTVEDRASVAAFLGRVNLYVGDYQRALQLFKQATQPDSSDALVWEGLGESLWLTGNLREAIEALGRAYALAETRGLAERLGFINSKLAQVLAANGQYADALSRIPETFAENDRFAYDLLLTRGRCYLALKQPQKAIEAAGLAAAKHEAPAVDPYLLRAQALTALKQYKSAVSAADQALQYDPSSGPVLVCKAQALIEGQIDLDQARRLLSRYKHRTSDENKIIQSLSPAISSQSMDGDTHYFLAQLYQALGHTEKALGEVIQALDLGLNLEISYPEAPAYQLKGELLAAAERWDEAISAICSAAHSFYSRGEYSAAIELFKQAETLNLAHRPQEPGPYAAPWCWYWADSLRYASSRPEFPYLDPDQMKQSLEVWTRGYGFNPPSTDFAWAYLARSLCLESMANVESDPERNYWEAAYNVEKSIILEPGNSYAWAYLGRYYRLVNLQASAMQANEVAFGLDPKESLVLIERAVILFNLGDDRAMEAVDRYQSSLNVPEPWTNVLKGMLLARDKNYPEALDLYDKALAEIGGNIQLEIFYRHARAQVLRLSGKKSEALADYQRIWELTSARESMDIGDYLMQRGWAAYQLGSFEVAAEIFKGLLTQGSNDPCDVRVNLTYCCLAQGLLAEADEWFNQALLYLQNRRIQREILDDLSEIYDRLDGKPENDSALNKIKEYQEAVTAKSAYLAGKNYDRREAQSELLEVIEAKKFERGSIPVSAARAGLARLYAEGGELMEAVTQYRLLEQESDQFPEARIGLEKSFASLQQDGDNKLREGNASEAMERFTEALAFAIEATDHNTREADLRSRIGYSHFVLNNLPSARENLTRAIELYRIDGNHRPGQALGAVCSALLQNVDLYWRLDSEWQALEDDSKTDERLSLDLRDARESLANYLDKLYQPPGGPSEVTSAFPSVDVIRVYIGELLIPEDTSAEGPLVKEYVPEMRARIRNDLGVRVPPVNLLDDPGMRPEGYVFQLDESPIGGGLTQPNMRYCPSPMEELQRVGIPTEALKEAPHPVTGRPGCWVGREYWDLAASNTFDLWGEPVAFAIHHLEAVLRQHLASFVGVQEVERLLEGLEESEAGLSLVKTALPDQASRIRFAHLLNALVKEHVPINDLEEILKAVVTVGLSDGDLHEDLRKLRLQIKRLLPGNSPASKYLKIPPELESKISSCLSHEDGKTFLAIPIEQLSEISSMISTFFMSQQEELSDKDLVVLTQGSEIRSFVRRLIEVGNLDLATVSQEEMFSGDEKLVAGE